MDKNTKRETIIYSNAKGDIYSVSPPETFLTFNYWIYLVPQFKPKNVLLLGVAEGTAVGLIRKIYGEDVEITGVDKVPCTPRYGIKFVEDDAKYFVKKCEHFDAVIVDLFDADSREVCDFVKTEEFAHDLAKITNYIIINTAVDTDLSAYNFLQLVTYIQPPGISNKIYYYEVNKIPNLFPYK